MKLVAWNVNHRTNPKIIPHSVTRFLSEYFPEVAIFSEFVDSKLLNQFYHEMKEIGFIYSSISEYFPSQNQILILSRLPMTLGHIQPPQITDSAKSNFLHVELPEKGLGIVGLRVPAYKSNSETKAYWSEIESIASKNIDRKLVFIGDLNYDPFRKSSSEAESIPFGVSTSFFIPKPIGNWSYISGDGRRFSKIDHAIVSTSLKVSDVRYMTNWKHIQLAGPTSTSPVSDHAVLSVSIDV